MNTTNKLAEEQIERVIRRPLTSKDEQQDDAMKYLGIDMSGYGEGDNRTKQGNLECKIKNYGLIKYLFPKETMGLEFETFKLESWKGLVWWGDNKSTAFDNPKQFIDFSGQSSAHIIRVVLELWNSEQFEKFESEDISY